LSLFRQLDRQARTFGFGNFSKQIQAGAAKAMAIAAADIVWIDHAG
jgi:hypothetical protein